MRTAGTDIEPAGNVDGLTLGKNPVRVTFLAPSLYKSCCDPR